MINKLKNYAIITLLLCALLHLLGSCSSRKTTTQTDKIDLKTDTEIQTKEIDNTKTKIDVYTDTEKQETTEIETVEPIDSSKPFSYNGKEYKNTKITKRKTNVLSKEKSKTNQVVENDKKAVKKERVKAVVNVKSKNKTTEKETIFGWWFWLLIAIMVLIGIKYRKELFLW